MEIFPAKNESSKAIHPSVFERKFTSGFRRPKNWFFMKDLIANVSGLGQIFLSTTSFDFDAEHSILFLVTCQP